MSNYIIQGQTLTDIADAIRAKTGDSNTINAEDMADAITNLPSGGSSEVKWVALSWGNKQSTGDTTYPYKATLDISQYTTGNSFILMTSGGATAGAYYPLIILPTGITGLNNIITSNLGVDAGNTDNSGMRYIYTNDSSNRQQSLAYYNLTNPVAEYDNGIITLKWTSSSGVVGARAILIYA